MKFKISPDLLGKKDFDAMVAVSRGRMRISNRLAEIEGPALPGMEEARGQGSPLMWGRYLAGLSSTLVETVYTAEPRDLEYSQAIEGDLSSFIAAVPAFLKIVAKEAPRNYGSVVSITNQAAVATDGFRLAWCDLTLKGLPDKGITLPVAHLKIAAMALAHASQVWLAADQTILGIEANNYTFRFKTSAVNYPNWRAGIPAETQPLEIDLPTVKEQAATIVRLLRGKAGSEPILIGGQAFNPRFVKDLPATGDVSTDKTGEILLVTGRPVNTVLVGVRVV